ncbi:MAG TPA: hypothetical protein VFB03_03485 [Candidatus Saccharimonadales bacterium]|nr:hypothetical protein [Candidatus Saccharimonadales bacterium]
MATQFELKGWAQAENPPKLTDQQWNMTGLLGVIFIVMAILQIISFSDFKDWFSSVGFGGPVTWAVVLILAELWAAAGLFKLRLSVGFRMVSGWLAVLAAGFWFIQNLRLVSDAKSGVLQNSGFFGKYLHMSPGWWTVLIATVFLLWTVHSVRLTSWTNKR